MAYIKNDMVFFDYKWDEKEKNNEVKSIRMNEQAELHRTEGFEMLNYINSLAKTWGWETDNVGSFRNLERIIRKEVPEDIQTHADILAWLQDNYTTI
jgi:hypothetical protein